ncbi:hypothetical protein [Isoalcanivorax indicus]|uniref:hypothetical protein n=1 Tax=Isoalcanivorax indicus TaxID=2202653 RepID=UPI000DBA3F9F|nr:hypothetical protein [Isoalcanivorax indicus]
MRRLLIPAAARHRATQVDADTLFSALSVTVTPSVPYSVPGPDHRDLHYHHPFAILSVPQSVVAHCHDIMAPQALCTNALLLLIGSILCGEEGCGLGEGARSQDGQAIGTVLAQSARWNLPQFRAPLNPDSGALDLLFSMHYLGTRQGGMDVTIKPYPGVPMPVWRIFLSTLSRQACSVASLHPLASNAFVVR